MALFAADLFRMYQRYAGWRGWRFEILDLSETGLGGLKEESAEISGGDVFARLKFESGVHRVQRVPETEAQGRIHTSAATVAVLPEAEEVDLKIDEKELRIDVFPRQRPWRPVGQHDGQRCQDHASADRARRDPAERGVAAQNKAKAPRTLRCAFTTGLWHSEAGAAGSAPGPSPQPSGAGNSSRWSNSTQRRRPALAGRSYCRCPEARR